MNLLTTRARCPPTPEGELFLWGTLFIDVLGWSRRLLAYDDVASYLDDPTKVNRLIQRPIMEQVHLRVIIQQMVDGLKRLGASDKRASERDSLDPATRRLQAEIDEHAHVFQSFGDCCVLSVPCRWHDEFAFTPAVLRLYGLFIHASLLMNTFFHKGTALRGAIEIGMGTQYDLAGKPGDFVGSSVARAYRLEQETADYPRIVVGPGLRTFLDRVEDPSHKNYTAQAAGLVPQLRRLVRVERDGSHSLDHLSQHLFKFLPQMQDLIPQGFAFIQKSFLDAQAAANTRLAGRYAVLMAHYIERFGAAAAGFVGPSEDAARPAKDHG